MVWDVSVSPAVLSKSLPHSHKDWITSCVWTPDCVVNLCYISCCKGMQLELQSYYLWSQNTILCYVVFISLPFLFQISSSNDGRLCLWDLQAGQRLKEISWRSPLTSVCCLVSRLYIYLAEKIQFVLFPSLLKNLHAIN